MGDGHIHKYMCVFVWVLTPDRLTEAKSIGGSGEEAWADLVTEAEGMTVVLHRVMARGPSASRLGVYIYIYVCVCVCVLHPQTCIEERRLAFQKDWQVSPIVANA